jgi:xanthine permease XanP
MVSTENQQTDLKYAVDETPPAMLSAAMGLQVVVLIIAGIVLGPVIVIRAAGLPDEAASWAVFAALVVCGLTTMIQARPIKVLVLGRFGAGFVLFMGTSGAFMAISIDAIKSGGMALLATLVLMSSLIQFVFSFRLGHLRRIITPTVGGTVIMVVAVTVFPIIFKMANVPMPGVPGNSIAAPATAMVTFFGIVAVSLFGKGPVRLWGPIIGVIAGYALAVAMGAYDFTKVAAAPWIGFPTGTWPGLDMSFGVDFWRLLLPFAIVTIVGAIETYGDGVAIQRLSKRKQEPIDFRAVQGAVNADGLGNFLSGLMGTLPNTTYSTSLSVVELTGVGARAVGVFGGAFLMLFAFCPKFSMFLISIPAPIAAAYIAILIILLFMHGLKLVTEDGLSFDNGMIVCVSFWLAVGFEEQALFAEHMPGWARNLFDNGMTAGGVIAILMSALLSLKRDRVKSLDLPASLSSIPKLQEFLVETGNKAGWDHRAVMRLELAGEEAMLFLIDQLSGGDGGKRHMRIAARRDHDRIEVEILAGAMDANLEKAVEGIDLKSLPHADDVGLRILSGIADRVRHEQFYGVDVLLLTLDSRPL